MTFYCHHCQQKQPWHSTLKRLFHDTRGWIHACHNCQKDEDDA